MLKEPKQKASIKFKRKSLTDADLLRLYKGILLPRMIEEKMLKLLRQGKVSKWFSGIGQEAISVGATLALQPKELIFPLHRNLGVFTNRDIPLHRLFSQWQGKMNGFTKGRDRSFHFGTLEYGIVGMISHLGPQLAIACGAALAYKLDKRPMVSVAYSGEGGTSEGDFHEALNIASVWSLPVIFIVENNGYGLSTPSSEQFNCKHIVDKAKGYGMASELIDGNNIIEVYTTIDKYAKKMRSKPAPVLIECMTFRMRGHEEASGVKYVPPELIEAWDKKDPLRNYEQFLLHEGVLSAVTIASMRSENEALIQQHLDITNDEPDLEANLSHELDDIYKPFDYKISNPTTETKEMRLVDAISDGLNEAMIRHPKLILMGQDIADYGGVFKITDGFLKKYGVDRVRNTPLCESGIVGTALGLSLEGYKAMMEMQFADFATCGFNQIVNNLAKLHYRWGENADVVIRMPTGAGTGAGPFHSQSNEAWYYHTPGLKIVYPSTPEDAKGLLLSAFEDPNPVMYFEHKALYRGISGNVPVGYYTTPIGKARQVRTGEEATIITYGYGVLWAEQLAEKENWDLDIIDLRTLLPVDWDAVLESVQKTHRVLVLHEDTLTGGIGADIAAYIAEHMFQYLDAPVMRVGSLDTPVPFAGVLEQQFLPPQRLYDQMLKLLSY
ncbi:MAG: dehydrogenase E1 component subunit alpha/beta [Saprospiraceae bacterium]|uniref:Dehydrogenase E1 component subunit alpha/beta n=1 Tax=Candidatus Opimibacter skivensis TaxID=2982028 RepID=A0A9D7SUS0_9BACT|nr:dehydrogenase E1 component subunit alpha/beta [Candidatus Opimibacter skivensis]